MFLERAAVGQLVRDGGWPEALDGMRIGSREPTVSLQSKEGAE